MGPLSAHPITTINAIMNDSGWPTPCAVRLATLRKRLAEDPYASVFFELRDAPFVESLTAETRCNGHTGHRGGPRHSAGSSRAPIRPSPNHPTRLARPQ